MENYQKGLKKSENHKKFLEIKKKLKNIITIIITITITIIITIIINITIRDHVQIINWSVNVFNWLLTDWNV